MIWTWLDILECSLLLVLDDMKAPVFMSPESYKDCFRYFDIFKDIKDMDSF